MALGTMERAQNEIMSYVIVVGNPFDGLSIFGSEGELDSVEDIKGFGSPDDANEVADATFHGYDWWVVELRGICYDES